MEGRATLRRLEWAVRALAQPAEVQAQLFPAFVCVADELALEFDEHWRRTRGSLAPLPSGLLGALAALDARLGSMSGHERAALWTNDALERAAEWAEVRRLAQAALAAAEWPTSRPPADRGDLWLGNDGRSGG